jgi:molybdopterin synthase catalytic subunit
MSEHKRKKVLMEGPILPSFVGDSIAKHSSNTTIGAHSIFLGQVRKDEVNGKMVVAINYSVYETMADEKFFEIRESAFEKFELTCLHIYHSIGEVPAGAISLFVFTSSKHRTAAIEACTYIVNRIKSEVPIWGKEIFEDNSYSWKQNT